MLFADRAASLQGSAIREMFKLLGKPGIISFAGGAPAPQLFPTEELSEIAAKIIKDNGAVALQYGVTEGYAPLLDLMTARMEKIGNIHAHDKVMITTGGNQALELCFKTLINEGDPVAVEAPSFIGGLNALRSYGADLKGVPVLSDGLDTDALEKLLKTTKIKLLYTITTFQNPSGITMCLEKRKKILELASKYDFYVLEDNPYGELRFKGENVATIKSMDTEGRVIYAGSLSKVLSSGMRIGFAVAREDIMEKMVICKQVADVHTPVLTQMMAAEFLKTYDFDAHIKRSCDLYGERCSAMLSAMDKYFPSFAEYTRPEGGIFLWCTLPEHYDCDKMLRTAIDEGVAFVSGSTAQIDMSAPSNELRLNFSLPDEEKIEKGIKILGDVIKNYK